MNKSNWIFIRGLTRGTIHWGDFEKTFLKISPNSKLEFLEIPGNGILNLEETPTDPVQLIETLILKSKLYKENDSIHICGISLGGMIALKWVELYPDKFASISVINTSLNQYSPFYKRLMPKNYFGIIKNLFFQNEYENESFILKTTSNNYLESKKHLDKFSIFAKNHRQSKFNFLKQLILANKIKILKIPAIPLKVIASKKDRLVHFNCSEKIAEKFNSKLYIHQTAGHDLPLDDPEWLISIVRNYLYN